MLEIKRAELIDYPEIAELHITAFPKSVGKPFKMLTDMFERGKAQLCKIMFENEFSGFFYLYFYKDFALIDYFAVKPEMRSKGLGAKSLGLLAEKYSDKKIFLEIEDHNSGEIQNRRKQFYERCGLCLNGLKVSLFGVDMEIMTLNTSVTFEDYMDLYSDMKDRSFAEKNIKKLS